jgi:hypothetical protein
MLASGSADLRQRLFCAALAFAGGVLAGARAAAQCPPHPTLQLFDPTPGANHSFGQRIALDAAGATLASPRAPASRRTRAPSTSSVAAAPAGPSRRSSPPATSRATTSSAARSRCPPPDDARGRREGRRRARHARGATYVFGFDGQDWVRTGRAARLGRRRAAQFGGCAALSADGSVLVVGAAGGGVSGADPGRAYVFRRDASGWSEAQLLAPVPGAPGDSFGATIAIDAAGAAYRRRRARRRPGGRFRRRGPRVPLRRRAVGPRAQAGLVALAAASRVRLVAVHRRRGRPDARRRLPRRLARARRRSRLRVQVARPGSGTRTPS